MAKPFYCAKVLSNNDADIGFYNPEFAMSDKFRVLGSLRPRLDVSEISNSDPEDEEELYEYRLEDIRDNGIINEDGEVLRSLEGDSVVEKRRQNALHLRILAKKQIDKRISSANLQGTESGGDVASVGRSHCGVRLFPGIDNEVQKSQGEADIHFSTLQESRVIMNNQGVLKVSSPVWTPDNPNFQPFERISLENSRDIAKLRKAGLDKVADVFASNDLGSVILHQNFLANTSRIGIEETTGDDSHGEETEETFSPDDLHRTLGNWRRQRHDLWGETLEEQILEINPGKNVDLYFESVSRNIASMRKVSQRIKCSSLPSDVRLHRVVPAIADTNGGLKEEHRVELNRLRELMNSKHRSTPLVHRFEPLCITSTEREAFSDHFVSSGISDYRGAVQKVLWPSSSRENHESATFGRLIYRDVFQEQSDRQLRRY